MLAATCQSCDTRAAKRSAVSSSAANGSQAAPGVIAIGTPAAAAAAADSRVVEIGSEGAPTGGVRTTLLPASQLQLAIRTPMVADMAIGDHIPPIITGTPGGQDDTFDLLLAGDEAAASVTARAVATPI